MNADTFVDREWQDLASEATYRESQKKSSWYLPAKEIFEEVEFISSTKDEKII